MSTQVRWFLIILNNEDLCVNLVKMEIEDLSDPEPRSVTNESIDEDDEAGWCVLNTSL